MTIASPPVPQARVLRTRNALLAAGRRLFAERAIDAVAIDDIVAAAGVAKGTFYNHFDDKDALLTAIVTEIRSTVEERIATINAGIEDPAVHGADLRLLLGDPVVEGDVARLDLDPRGAEVLLDAQQRHPAAAGVAVGPVREVEAVPAREVVLLDPLTVDGGKDNRFERRDGLKGCDGPTSSLATTPAAAAVAAKKPKRWSQLGLSLKSCPGLLQPPPQQAVPVFH